MSQLIFFRPVFAKATPRQAGFPRRRFQLWRGRQDYQDSFWGIDSARMQLEVRNRSEVASASSVAEGRALNRTVTVTLEYERNN